MPPRYITILRVLTALILAGMALAGRNWLLLPLGIFLIWQAYRASACAVCDAGFCPGEKK